MVAQAFLALKSRQVVAGQKRVQNLTGRAEAARRTGVAEAAVPESGLDAKAGKNLSVSVFLQDT